MGQSSREEKVQRQRSDDGSSWQFDGAKEYRVKITDSCGVKLNQMILNEGGCAVFVQ